MAFIKGFPGRVAKWLDVLNIKWKYHASSSMFHLYELNVWMNVKEEKTVGVDKKCFSFVKENLEELIVLTSTSMDYYSLVDGEFVILGNVIELMHCGECGKKFFNADNGAYWCRCCGSVGNKEDKYFVLKNWDAETSPFDFFSDEWIEKFRNEP